MDFLKNLLSTGRRENFEKNQHLFLKGDKAVKLYLVLKGRAYISMSNAEGEEFVLKTYGPGDYFGETDIFRHGIRSYDAFVLKGAMLTSFTSFDIKKILEKDPCLSFKLIEHLCETLDGQLNFMFRDNALTSYEKICKVLFDLADSKKSAHVEISNKELSLLTSASRQYCYRCLRELEDRGAITYTRSKFLIRDKEFLKREYIKQVEQ